MAGNSSVRGDQTVTHTDNMSFDGTDRGGAMTTDGQLWIGATASNRADNGGHVRLGSLTAGTGITVTNGAGTITIATTASLTDLHTATYIVSSSGTLGTGANYSSIASAIAAAVGTGINATIFIMPGSNGVYTENITLPAGINLVAFTGDADTPNVTINGTVTMTAAGTSSISGIRLQTNSAFAIAVTGIAASILNLYNCYINASNNTAISYTSSSVSSAINFYRCSGNIGTTGIALYASSGAGGVNFYFSNFTNSGASTTASTASSGAVNYLWSIFMSPFTFTGTSGLGCALSNFNTENQNVTSLTFGGSAGSAASDSKFSSGTASAISIGGTLALQNCIISSSNTNAVTGAGSVSFGNLLLGTPGTINVTTQAPIIRSNDAVQIKTPGAYPYTTVPQDGVILVDTASARTITPLASPSPGQRHIIKDNVGSAGTNNITVTPSGKNIDGAASFVITNNYGSITIIYNGVQWIIV